MVISSYDYLVRADGQREAVTETVLNVDGSTYRVVEIDWTYDALNRLTSETYDVQGATEGDYTDVYVMDLVGSRLSKVHDAAGTAEDETISSTYNANDQLLTTDNGQLTTTYTYDANGSLTATTGATAATYGYDLRNRMVSATVDGVAATYTYDDRGVRVSKTENGVTTYYTVDHANPTGYAQVLEEKSSAVPGATPDKDDERGRS